MDFTLTLPGGEQLPGTSPVVVVGPNGSGKTRQTRQLTAPVPVDFINALILASKILVSPKFLSPSYSAG